MIYRRDSAICPVIKTVFSIAILIFFGIRAAIGGTVLPGSSDPAGFKPVLLKVEVSANLGVPGDVKVLN